ncbi:MAG: hypothetical protein L6Q99_18155 [Planctomycetes bacterium]|nr:hypothetical protein [Planctomycetota bacterium]
MRIASQRSSSSRRGAALFVALFAAASVAVLATCLLQISGSVQKRQLASADLRRAFYLADAGLAEAYAGLTIGKTGNVGSASSPAKLGKGVFFVQATDVDADHVRLESTGMAGRARATVEMTVERGEESVATLGFFANQPLTVPAGASVGGYDSSAPADSSKPGLGGVGGLAGGGAPSDPPKGRIGSNGDIVLQGTARAPTTVTADLAPGAGHQATIGRHVTHTGTISPRTASAPLPAVELPFEPTGAGVDHQSPNTLVVQPGELGIAYLHLASGSHAIIQGPCSLVVDDLTVASGATLEFDTDDGAVGVWVGDSLSFADGSQVVCSSNDPTDVTIQVASDSPVSFGAAGAFYGVLYAPEAQATVGSGAAVNGACVAEQVVLSPGAKLNFDVHIDEATALDVLPKLLAWRILELESVVNNAAGNDPFEILGVDPARLLPPSKSHADVPLHVVYQNLAGTTLTYDGMESGFDWANVRAVQTLERSGKPVGYMPADTTALAAETKTGLSDAIGVLSDNTLTSAQLTASLIAASPLTSNDLVRIVNASAKFTSSDLTTILMSNSPLAANVLDKALIASPALPSNYMAKVLIASSPLPPHIVAQVLADALTLTPLEKANVLAAQ